MLRNLFGYTATIYFSTLLTSTITFVVTLLIPRELGAEALGKYALFLVVISLGATVGGFGLNRTIVRFLGEGRVDGKRFMRVAFLLAVGVTGVASAIALLGWNHIGPVYALGLVCVGPSLVFEFSSSYFRARFEQRKEAALMIMTSAITSVVTVVLIFTTGWELGPVYAGTFSYVCTMVIMLTYFALRKESDWGGRPSGSEEPFPYRQIVTFTRPLWIASIIGLVSQGADRFVLEHFVGYAALGEYFLALRFFDLIERPLGIYSKALLAGFSTAKDQSFEHYKKITTLNLMVLPTVVLLMMGVVPIFVSIIFPDPYPQLPVLFALIGGSIVVKSVEVVNNVLTVAHDYPYANQQKQLVASVVTLPVMISLVMWIGAYGAALSVLIYWTLATFVHIYYMRTILPEHTAFSTARCVRSLLLFGVLTFVVCWTEWYALSLIAAAGYLVMGSVMGTWEWDQMMEMVRGMRSALVRLRKSPSAST